jgi:hypothetical protein
MTFSRTAVRNGTAALNGTAVLSGAVAAALLTLSSAGALAEGTPPTRLRGAIEKLDGNVLTVKTRQGKPATVKLADDVGVIGVLGASLADVTEGKFIGTATKGEKDGALVALEVVIFPEEMRGFKEGHYPWDVQPQSMMTNATVSGVSGTTAGAKGRVLMVKYKDGEKKVYVPENAPVVTLKKVDRAALKPGAHVFIGAAERQPDGSFTTKGVNVGLDGLVPPM